VTIDFSNRLEAGVKRFFTDDQILKCAFHAPQLLNRGLLKELTRLKNEKYQNEIKELMFLKRLSLEHEEIKQKKIRYKLNFEDSKKAWQIYLELRAIFSLSTLFEIEKRLRKFLQELSLNQWKGVDLLKDQCISLFPKHGLTEKSFELFKTRVYRTWRGIIRYFRKEMEDMKSGFKDAKYLVLMNPINMDAGEKKELRRALAKFPWLRPIRRIMTQFYYQFRVSPAKRRSLRFLSQLVSENCHTWLKSAVKTLITYEEQIFRFQVLCEQYPELENHKAIKVVDESTMRKINKLYQTQFGMRNLENLNMRLKHYLECPFIIVPSVLEEFKS
jgi:hypothetical protein